MKRPNITDYLTGHQIQDHENTQRYYVDLEKYVDYLTKDAEPENKQMDGEYLRPCDVVDMVDVHRLNEHGIAHNDESITIRPSGVLLQMGHTTVFIHKNRFKMFAEWFLEPQIVTSRGVFGYSNSLDTGA